MSSRDGYARADMDTGLFHDPKVLALARRLRDHSRTGSAMTLYAAAVLASWNADQRLTLAEAAPAWWLGDPAEYLPDLHAVGLLDREGRIPEHAYAAWTARARGASDAARLAANARWQSERDKAAAAAIVAAPDSPSSASVVRSHSDGIAAAMPSLTDSRPAGPSAGKAGSSREPAREAPPQDGAKGAPPSGARSNGRGSPTGVTATYLACLDDPNADAAYKAVAEAALRKRFGPGPGWLEEARRQAAAASSPPPGEQRPEPPSPSPGPVAPAEVGP